MLDAERDRDRRRDRRHARPHPRRRVDGGHPGRASTSIARSRLTHTLYECRALTKAAREAGVATQMGNQGHATEGRPAHQRVDPGRRHRRGPRGPRLVRPGRPALEAGHRPSQGDAAGPVDPGLGPLARPGRRSPLPPGLCPRELARLARLRHRGARRHGLPHHRSSRLGLRPGRRPASSRPARRSTARSSTATSRTSRPIPIAAIITYEFPARGELPPVRMTWYEGGLMPPDPPEMAGDQQLPDNGVLYVGSKGKMYHSSHGGMPAAPAAGSCTTRRRRSPRRWRARPAITRNGSRPARAARGRSRTSTTPAR